MVSAARPMKSKRGPLKRQPGHVEDLRGFAGKRGEAPPPLWLPPTLEEMETTPQVKTDATPNYVPSAGVVGLWPVAMGYPPFSPQCCDDSGQVYQMYLAVPFPQHVMLEQEKIPQDLSEEMTETWRDLLSGASSEQPPGLDTPPTRPGFAVPYHVPSASPPLRGPLLPLQPLDLGPLRGPTVKEERQEREDKKEHMDKQDNTQGPQNAELQGSAITGESVWCMHRESLSEPLPTWSQHLEA